MSSSRPSSASSQVAGFGTNEWLVEEMYQQYLSDPASVDQAWHEFFADYRPGSPVDGGGDREEAPKSNGTPAAAPQPAAPAKPAAPQAPAQQAPAGRRASRA
ncbi:2-oxoglutarate dehydrogenase E1 subunit family protein, partial [Blastococcus atacamensis]|uniref:2-oxoglutarate dehydrogenase E1 subunit family protein n=1 Tax=Blastococcus atacamensis TaxID=2070508 RepID=UPI001E3F8E7F